VTFFSLTTNVHDHMDDTAMTIDHQICHVIHSAPTLEDRKTHCQKAFVYSVEFFIRLVQYLSMKAQTSACRSSLESMHIQQISFALVN
jgi:hypothetical protein